MPTFFTTTPPDPIPTVGQVITRDAAGRELRVRAVSLVNVDLASGGAGSVIDGVTAKSHALLGGGEYFLFPNQTAPAENGIYEPANFGGWQRVGPAAMWKMDWTITVDEGDKYKGSKWKWTKPTPFTLDSTAVTITNVSPLQQDLTLSSALYETETLTYLDNIVKNSGSIRRTTLDAVDVFVKALKSAGVWSLIDDMGIFCGDQLAAALVKLKYPSTIKLLTNVNFVELDFIERGSNGGLLGNGTSKYLNTGVSLKADCSRDATNAHMAVYCRTNTWNNTARKLISNYELTMDVSHSGGSNKMGTCNSGQFGPVVGSTYDPRGMWLASISGSAGATVYKNGVATGTVGGNPSNDFVNAATTIVFAQSDNAGGTSGQYLNKNLAFYSQGGYLTSAQQLAFYNAVQALMTTLGRNV